MGRQKLCGLSLFGEKCKNPKSNLTPLALNYRNVAIGQSIIVHADCLEWLSGISENSLHGIVTDPPYGVKEYEFDQLEKRANGNGGIWRIPPSFDGSTRQPLPRSPPSTARSGNC